MSDPLPISILPNKLLSQQFKKINSVANKLEAQLNFQTMTANWYEDEDSIVFIQFCLETSISFQAQKNLQQSNTQKISDDVFYIEMNDDNKLICFIAITEIELDLIAMKNQILPVFLQKKILKVLNIIAKHLGKSCI